MKIVVIIFCLAVLVVLGIGLYTMARGGEFSLKYSNKLMRLRVALQAVAIAMIMLALFMAKHQTS